ncbi:MAG: putative enzyme related to lactoylglutathione lyase [Cognaticolwellia sp.]
MSLFRSLAWPMRIRRCSRCMARCRSADRARQARSKAASALLAKGRCGEACRMATQYSASTHGISNDVDKGKTFYPSVLGWNLVETDDGTMFSAPGGTICHMQPTEEAPPSWCSFLSVDYLEASTAQAGKSGSILAPPTPLSSGAFSVVATPSEHQPRCGPGLAGVGLWIDSQHRADGRRPTPHPQSQWHPARWRDAVSIRSVVLRGLGPSCGPRRDNPSSGGPRRQRRYEPGF